jgi:hypothetical protein
MPKPPSGFRYCIHNWPQYNRALINRSRLTVWFDEHAIAAWRHTAPATGPGAPRLYSELAIECALVFKSVYHLSLRAAQGFLSSVVGLMKLPLPVPDYSTVSRRQGALQAHESLMPRSGPCHVVIDATGLRVYGAGEWRVWKHRASRRRTWRKLHLGIDETTREIVAVKLTESQVHDSQPLPTLLEQIPGPTAQVSGMGPTTHGPATKRCSSAVRGQSSSPGARPNRAPPRILQGSVPHAIKSCSKLGYTGARRGSFSVGTRGRVLRRIRCSASSGCLEGISGCGAWRLNVPRPW